MALLFQTCKDDGAVTQLVNSWLKDKDIRVVLTSVVEKSAWYVYQKMSRVLADIIFHLIQQVPEPRGDLYADGFLFLARVGRTGMDGIPIV